jgi:hypothetical protein
MRHGYVVPMRWMVIYEYGVPGGALNLNSTNYQTMVTMGILPYQEKIPMVERTRDFMISSQKRCPLDHEAGL